MTPLLIKKINSQQIEDKFPIDPIFKENYLKFRPGILDKTDIFFENTRSFNIPEEYKNFSLFKEVQEVVPETIFICPIYLEIFEYCGMPVLSVIETLSKYYYPNRVIFQWNHDIDFSEKYTSAKDFDNAYIINFNTSTPIKNDILVPFWTINTNRFNEDKKFLAGFIGSINNNLRGNLIRTISGKANYYHAQGLSQEEFYKKSAQCTFSLCPKGQGLSSYRFYESFHIITIPVLIADQAVLPFSNRIDYDKICIRLPESKVNDFKFINDLLSNINFQQMYSAIDAIKMTFTLLGVQNEIHSRMKS